MNDSPGWASPGSSPSDDRNSENRNPGAGGKEPGTDSAAGTAGTPSTDSASGATGGPGTPPQPTGAPNAPEVPQAPDAPDAPAQQAPPAGWSGAQPPPGDWTAPADSRQQPKGWGQAPSGGQPQWGGAPGNRAATGWGGSGFGGWQGPPPAAKPGVVPLRPLAVGEILDGAVSTMRGHWRTVLGISLAVAVITQLALVLVQGLYLKDAADTSALEEGTASREEVTDALTGIFSGLGIVLAVTVVGTIVATALLTTVTSRAVIGRSLTPAQAWHAARPQMLRLAGLTVLLPLIMIGIVLAACIPALLVALAGAEEGAIALVVLGVLAGMVVAIWLTVRFSLASPALMLERQTVLKSLGRSAKLVKGSWWRVFGIQLLGSIIANVLASVVAIPFSVIAGVADGGGVSTFLNESTDYGWAFLIINGVGAVIGSTLSLPVSAGVTVLLYIDQRIRREALDLELGRAAGLPGYTGQGPAAGS